MGLAMPSNLDAVRRRLAVGSWLQLCLCLLSSGPWNLHCLFTSWLEISISQAPGNMVLPLFYPYPEVSEGGVATPCSAVLEVLTISFTILAYVILL